jgi:hypothetical protein
MLTWHEDHCGDGVHLLSDKRDQAKDTRPIAVCIPVGVESTTGVEALQQTPQEWSANYIVMASFAEDWFVDARDEATRNTAAARRKEVIFAVCMLESYLFEWARDIILRKYGGAKLLDKLDKYFPKSDWKSLIDKWKDVPKGLCEDGLISSAPDLSGQTWQEFRERVYTQYRHALIHASASRPQPKTLTSPTAPPDWKTELAGLEAGWAVRIVVRLIRDLNTKAGTNTPQWLDGVGS